MEPDKPITLEGLVEDVSPSVVSVVWTTGRGGSKKSVVSAGCVLHNFGNHNYILTSSRQGCIQNNSNLWVRFHDGVELRAYVLLSVHVDLEFLVLYTESSHNSDPIQLTDDPISFSFGLCVVPKIKSRFHKVQGFIPTPSCRANNLADVVSEITDDYFIFVCQHGDTAIMKSAPIFHENGQVNGFICEDCSLPSLPEETLKEELDEALVDREAKLCVKGRLLEARLRMVTQDNDWRAGLVNMVENMADEDVHN